MKLGQFDWRKLQRYLSPRATQDLNAFLEEMPQHAGKSLLIAAGIIWAAAGGLGLYTTIQSRQLAELRTELEEKQAVKPSVPVVRNVSANSGNVREFVEKAKLSYPDLEMRASGAKVYLTAKDTRFYPQFREAIGHIMNGGRGWRVNVEQLCVGRDCEKNPLAITLKVNKVSIDMLG